MAQKTVTKRNGHSEKMAKERAIRDAAERGRTVYSLYRAEVRRNGSVNIISEFYIKIARG